MITTTAATGGGFISESVNYLDVGLKLEVEPSIYLVDDVGIKVGLEVSNITNVVRGVGNNSNTLAYQIGTRNANTVLRLHDGETQMLAGLINNEDRQSANKVPGLGDLPILGKLFSSNNDNKTKTELVLLITPHVVRNIERPKAEESEFLSGAENSIGKAPKMSGGSPGSPGSSVSRAEMKTGAPPAPAPAEQKTPVLPLPPLEVKTPPLPAPATH